MELLARKSCVLRVSGTSMEPTLAEGCWVRFAQRPPRTGDVVVFRRADGALVVHRFLGRRPARMNAAGKTMIVTKPDVASDFDVEVGSSAVLGTACSVRTCAEDPWSDLTVGALRRAMSLLWLVRYWMRRGVRRVLR